MEAYSLLLGIGEIGIFGNTLCNVAQPKMQIVELSFSANLVRDTNYAVEKSLRRLTWRQDLQIVGPVYFWTDQTFHTSNSVHLVLQRVCVCVCVCVLSQYDGLYCCKTHAKVPSWYVSFFYFRPCPSKTLCTPLTSNIFCKYKATHLYMSSNVSSKQTDQTVFPQAKLLFLTCVSSHVNY